MATGVQVEGLRQTVKALEQFGVEVTDLKDVFGGIAAEGARLAKGFAPNRTGRLDASIRGNRAKNKAVVAAGNARRVPYAGPLNYGWAARGIKARLFMQRADTALQPKAVDMLDQGLTQAARKAGLDSD